MKHIRAGKIQKVSKSTRNSAIYLVFNQILKIFFKIIALIIRIITIIDIINTFRLY